jgi:hypothetical protein
LNSGDTRLDVLIFLLGTSGKEILRKAIVTAVD